MDSTKPFRAYPIRLVFRSVDCDKMSKSLNLEFVMIQLEYNAPVSRAKNRWELRDADRLLGVADTWEQLQQSVLSAPQRAFTPNTIIDLTMPQGDTLSIGVAGPHDNDNPGISKPLCCLNFTDSSRNPPYLAIVGDASLTYETGGVVVFRYEDGAWTEILRRNCVPVETMLQVVKHAFDTGCLPTWIQWDEI